SLGRYLLKALLGSENHPNIVIVDRSQEAFKILPVEFNGLTLVRDASEIPILEEAKIKTADVAFMVTNDENLNLILGQVAKEIYKVPKVIARITDEADRKSSELFKITAINPLEWVAQEMVSYAINK
ncbi:MAG: NAD-binding protein, partial [Bacteroidota bacterium]